MAHSQTRSAPSVVPAPTKMSYSKIAAMPAPTSLVSQTNTRKEARNPTLNGVQELAVHPKLPEQGHREASPVQSVQMPSDRLQFPLGKLSLVDAPIDITFSEHNGDSGDSYEDDRSQVSTSSLNKPHSFDTKSLASVTTFAMDDKESIRPDDSASVRAVDDDHPHPGLSRTSSFQHDTDLSVQRVPARPFTSNVTIPGRRFPTLVNPPKFGNFGSLSISPVLECQDIVSQKPPVPLISPDEPRESSTVVGLPPDEKLIEALASVKDRLPLLQLEEKIIYFITSTSSDVLELPPQNGFTRLLTHRLADYYGLAHQNTEDHSSVRVSRSGTHGLPTPLSQLAKAVPIGSTNGPSSAAVKIMRREQLGGRQFSAGNSTAPSSSVPSKTTSENGNDGPSEDGLTSPTESTPSRDKSKLTREEREAQYKAVRERIFGDTQEMLPNEVVSTGENSADLSRSSSSSGKKKHRKHKQPKDDSFEARSAFVQSYTPLQSHYNNAYMDHNMTNGYPTSPVSFDPGMYGTTPTQNFPGFDTGMAYANIQPYSPTMMQQYPPADWQHLQTSQNGYFMYPQGAPYQPGPNMMAPQSQMMQAQIPDWYTAQYAHNMSNVPQMSPGAAYMQQNVSDPRNMVSNEQFGRPFHRPHSTPSAHHPHQGSKNNKSLFNPQTRSFVPSNAEGRSGRGGRQQKQARNSQGSIGQASAGNPNSGAYRQEDSLRLRYGTPSSLPKKPPPTETKHVFEANATPATVNNDSVADEVAEEASGTRSSPVVVNGGVNTM